jgi:hypothetical protein
MDAASLLPVLALDLRPVQRVLDMRVRVGPMSFVWGGKKQFELAKVDFSETE